MEIKYELEKDDLLYRQIGDVYESTSFELSFAIISDSKYITIRIDKPLLDHYLIPRSWYRKCHKKLVIKFNNEITFL